MCTVMRLLSLGPHSCAYGHSLIMTQLQGKSLPGNFVLQRINCHNHSSLSKHMISWRSSAVMPEILNTALSCRASLAQSA